MSDLHVKYLLVGGGLAASEAAQAIRRIDPEGDLLMVGQEINRPYHRPPLSKQYLRGQVRRESLFAAPAEWFANNRIQLRTGRRVSGIDVTRNAVTLDNGQGLSFDRLLIAIGGGAAPLAIPGAELPNLFYLRTLEDADLLQHMTGKAAKTGMPHPNGRGCAVVIGAGPLGVELAASLSHAGLHVEMAVSAEHPWRRFAGETTGRFIARFLESRGVVVHRGDRAARLEGDGRIQRVVLASGKTIPCDFAVTAVGISIHKDILRGTPIAAEQAILVDSTCRTNVRDIFAAGDCAAVFDPLFGKHRMMNHWDSAARTGRIAGTNMAGGDASFKSASFFDTEVFGVSIGVWGEARLVDRRIIRGLVNTETPEFAEFGVAADGRLAQIIAVGKLEPRELYAKLIERRASIVGKEDLLKDPTQSVEQMFGAEE
jgi:3-phenylpropionate/trans-cinnamate dioxygenase ferredoxin reductase component